MFETEFSERQTAKAKTFVFNKMIIEISVNLRICSCLACVYRVMDARGKFGEHEKCVREAQPRATIAFWVLSKLPACIHNSIYAQLKARANSFITERRQGSARRSLLLWYSAKFSQRTKKVNKRPDWLVKNCDTPHFILCFEREHLNQLTENCEWKAQNLRGKWRKSEPNELKCH